MLSFFTRGDIYMKFVDIDNWERKDHYNNFKQFDYPHINICANVDITEFYRYIKEKEYPFYISILYVVTKTANKIKEFRYRIREDKLIEHEFVSPAFTVMNSKEIFGYCTVEFKDEFKNFKANAIREIERAENNISIENKSGCDNVIYTKSIPWVSFTSITHPVQMNPVDSIPRIAWGKYFEENGKIKLPLSVQVHHSLADGVHIGKYFKTIQEILDNPVKYL
jgi:chloramphenicol O-acetyltransferase type A